MYFSKIICPDIANGLGCRCTIFVSGCNHKCHGCFNPKTWDFLYGSRFTENTINNIIDKLRNEYIKGLTILGGEPLEPGNQPDVLKLIDRVRIRFSSSKDIWLYTGCTWEELNKRRGAYVVKCTKEILHKVDILVDGRFIESLKDISLKFRGSSNQRIIKCKESLNSDRLILSELNN